jgi:KaiC/GvpD/RAD55 family RecA-like ATPase
MPIYVKNIKSQNNISIVTPEEYPSESNIPVRRLHLRYILNVLETAEATSIVTSELPAGFSLFSGDGMSKFLVDGVILLNFDPTMDRRKLSVIKMRSIKHTLKPQNIEISKDGIKII